VTEKKYKSDIDTSLSLSGKKWKEGLIPLVSISCITYNHEKYIEDALKGFLSQKTTFPVEILIHDDASTDGTPDIIKKYEREFPQLIKPIYQTENQHSKKDGTLGQIQRRRALGKYYATCEGDDYWTDPDKLQKQIDFLEKHPDYVMSCGGYESLHVETGERKTEIEKRLLKNGNGFTFTLSEMSMIFFTKTLTSVFRMDIMKKSVEAIRNYNGSRDTHLFYHIMKHGKGYYFGNVLGVYRIHRGGVKSLVGDRTNKLSALNRSKEMFEKNRDYYTRALYFRSVVSLFRYNLTHKYAGNTVKHQIQLLFQLIWLILSPRMLWHFLKTYVKIKL